jgi:hypothetical protein
VDLTPWQVDRLRDAQHSQQRRSMLGYWLLGVFPGLSSCVSLAATVGQQVASVAAQIIAMRVKRCRLL